MYCTKKITDDLTWVGANDRRLAMFEGVYSVPKGISYNSYLLLDDFNILFDTVDKAVSKLFFQNLEYALAGKKLDYVVVHHMEPDHTANLMELLFRYPDTKIICNKQALSMMGEFYNIDLSDRAHIVGERSTFNTGHHELKFFMAPMVHWPEVMVTYDTTDKILFSADAFGTFGALNGAIFADEVNFDRDYMGETRRYYANIIGKFGKQVQHVLKKVPFDQVKMLCPLHGFVWRENLESVVDKYNKWCTYTPEETGVMIAYASIYGNTENAAEIISSKLRDLGVKTVMYDVSVTNNSEIIAAAFEWSHLLFASSTYNAGIFVRMDELLHDLADHNIQNRTIAFLENGSWAPSSGELMRDMFKKCTNLKFIDETITVASAIKPRQINEIEAFVDAIYRSVKIGA
jgi:flavorubredoxin